MTTADDQAGAMVFDRADIRDTELYEHVHRFYERWHAPGFDTPHAFADVAIHPSQDVVAATASVLTSLAQPVASRIATADPSNGLRLVTDGPNDDRLPRWSPDGQTLAFLSDRRRKEVFQVHLLPTGLGEAVCPAEVEGTVEHLAWSPDGTRVLLGVAQLGADRPAGAGSGTLGATRPADAGWLPTVVSSAPADDEWRSAWVLDVATATLTRASRPDLNIWEACWAGPNALVAVCSDGDPSEAAWFSADVRLIDLDGGPDTILLQPRDHVGLPVANPRGTRLACVEAVCSDRGIIAGEVRLVDLTTGALSSIDALGTDVTDLHWLDDDWLGFAGLRGFESVHGLVDVTTGKAEELWASHETSGQRYPQASWRPDRAFAASHDSYTRPPCLVLAEDGGRHVLGSTAHAGTEHVASLGGRLQQVTWQGRDGLEIQGLLATPDGPGPFPLVVHVHGGPVGAFRNRWAMGSDIAPLLVADGYAVLHPNPRGSSGRGVEFARMVVGDMGGEDAFDILAGIDALTDRDVVDPDRVGVTGGSYGGYMTAWLITRDQRFRAAVPMFPITDWFSQHHTSNLGSWDAAFLDGRPRAADGLAHERSPVMHCDKVVTPTLLTAGAQDIATPATQALEFHMGLAEVGVESVCCTYPNEGHGVRAFPARIDLAARVLGWFRRHMPA